MYFINLIYRLPKIFCFRYDYGIPQKGNKLLWCRVSSKHIHANHVHINFIMYGKINDHASNSEKLYFIVGKHFLYSDKTKIVQTLNLVFRICDIDVSN